jgi:hypothetical protein
MNNHDMMEKEEIFSKVLRAESPKVRSSLMTMVLFITKSIKFIYTKKTSLNLKRF